MPYVPVNFDDAVEPKPATPGHYQLQVTECAVSASGPNSKKPGSPQFIFSIGFVDTPNVPNMRHYVPIPAEDDTAEDLNSKLLNLKRFLVLFNIPYDRNGIDTDKIAMDSQGATAKGEVELSQPDTNGNVYNRLRVPRIKN